MEQDASRTPSSCLASSGFAYWFKIAPHESSRCQDHTLRVTIAEILYLVDMALIVAAPDGITLSETADLRVFFPLVACWFLSLCVFGVLWRTLGSLRAFLTPLSILFFGDLRFCCSKEPVWSVGALRESCFWYQWKAAEVIHLSEELLPLWKCTASEHFVDHNCHSKNISVSYRSSVPRLFHLDSVYFVRCAPSNDVSFPASPPGEPNARGTWQWCRRMLLRPCRRSMFSLLLSNSVAQPWNQPLVVCTELHLLVLCDVLAFIRLEGDG